MMVEYGPPAVSGVKTLQYVSGIDGIGDDADYVTTNLQRAAGPISVLALGTWVYARFAGRPDLEKQAFAVSVGALAVQLLTRLK